MPTEKDIANIDASLVGLDAGLIDENSLVDEDICVTVRGVPLTGLNVMSCYLSVVGALVVTQCARSSPSRCRSERPEACSAS